ncbi:hypothetical protein OUZ56_018732 [Daphnia magna]|uniref:Uncharacterized protein n=1 Tax=Daphnia magna TaxID=35525 RepID=A0ABQ9Z9L2_9CRUS|nr:hypothetical protein OUZ56_018732 [Daphnia magna]
MAILNRSPRVHIESYAFSMSKNSATVDFFSLKIVKISVSTATSSESGLNQWSLLAMILSIVLLTQNVRDNGVYVAGSSLAFPGFQSAITIDLFHRIGTCWLFRIISLWIRSGPAALLLDFGSTLSSSSGVILSL